MSCEQLLASLLEAMQREASKVSSNGPAKSRHAGTRFHEYGVLQQKIGCFFQQPPNRTNRTFAGALQAGHMDHTDAAATAGAPARSGRVSARRAAGLPAVKQSLEQVRSGAVWRCAPLQWRVEGS